MTKLFNKDLVAEMNEYLNVADHPVTAKELHEAFGEKTKYSKNTFLVYTSKALRAGAFPGFKGTRKVGIVRVTAPASVGLEVASCEGTVSSEIDALLEASEPETEILG